jgi:mannose-1-phosphate guanylyltransferase
MLPGVRNVMTVTNRELFFKIEDEYREIADIPEESIETDFILEPFGRNTAPAIAAASIQVAERHGEDTHLLVLTADHLIANWSAFANAVADARGLAAQGKIVTFGIQPTSPETGYGYIEADGNNVLRFVEKPDLETARVYLASGNFLWNSGMFCFSAGAMLREMEEHAPEILAASRACLEQSRKAEGEGFSQIELSPEHFQSVPDDSIDYAVMEKTRNAAVVGCDIGWSDIGCWKSLGDLVNPDENSNRIQGDVVVQDTKNCTIKSEDRMIGAVGLENLIIVDTPDALLVANKNRAQDVKKIFSHLKQQGHEAHKLHRTVHRPWGTYTVLEEGPGFKIKRIEVKPGASLSLQLHHHRSEHWIVVCGTARVTNADQVMDLNINESTFIPAENKHRLENARTEPLIMIEVQTGGYLGEDDIVRFQDAYGRVS